MAVIKMKPPIKNDSTRTVTYACNGKNKENSADLKPCPGTEAAIAYISNDAKVEYISGINCSPETAAKQFIMTRQLWNKDEGAKCYHLIQSFKPGEITSEKAHKVGRELAAKIAPGYEIVIGTHIDKAHIHNHIVINSVNKDFGYKYDSTRAQMQLIKDESDALCKRYMLSVIDKKDRKPGVTQAEIYMKERGIKPWKDELKEFINDAVVNSNNKEGFIKYLNDTYGVQVKWQNVNISFLYPGKQKFVRGDTLGELYTKEKIEAAVNEILVKEVVEVKSEVREKVEVKGKRKHLTEVERYEKACEKNNYKTEERDIVIVTPKVVDISDLKELRKTDLKAFLENRGYTLTKQLNNTYRVEELTGLYVTENGRKWESKLFNRSGNAIDFLMRFERMQYDEAVNELSGMDDLVKYDLPDRADSYENIKKYLVEENDINEDLFNQLIEQGLIYEAKITGNCVFLSFDYEMNTHGGYEAYNTKDYKSGHYCAMSNFENDFHIKGNNDTLYVYADPLDVLKQESIQIAFEEDSRGHKLFTKHSEAVINYIDKNNISKVVTLNKNGQIIRELDAHDEKNMLNALILAKKYRLETYLKDNHYTVESSESYYNIKEIEGLKVNYADFNYLDRNGEEVIKERLQNNWYDENRDKEGSTVKFLTDYENYSYWEAIERLSGIKTIYNYSGPAKALDNETLIKYLKEHGIDKNKVDELIRKGYLYQDEGGDIVFNFVDKNGKVRGGYWHDCYSENDGKDSGFIEKSNMNYSFNIKGKSDKLIVFKDPITLLKYYSAGFYQNEHLILSYGDSAIGTYLKENMTVDKVIFYNDNPEKVKVISAGEELYLCNAYKKVRDTSLYAYMIEQGYKMEFKDGKYTVLGHEDLYIRDDKWYSEKHGTIAGTTMSFIMKYEKYNFKEALSIATRDNTIYPLKAPERLKTNDKLLKYLVFDIGMDKSYAASLIKQGFIYETHGEKIVFTYTDNRGYVRSAYEQEVGIKNRYGKSVEGSNYNYGFRMDGNTDRVIVFRDHKQLLKYANEEYKANIENGTNVYDYKIIAFNEKAVERFLEENKGINEIKYIEPERRDRTFDNIVNIGSHILKLIGDKDYRKQARARALEFGKYKDREDMDYFQKLMKS